MLLHSVYFWLTDPARETCRGEFEEALEALLEIEEIREGSVGKPAGTESRPVTDHSFDYSLHLKFDSVASHNAYQDHPDHHQFVERCRDWWAKVIVYDSSLN